MLTMQIFPIIRPLMLVMALAFAAVSPSAAQDNSEKLQAARDLLKATNAEEQFAVVVPLMFRQMRQAMPPPGPDQQDSVDQVFAEVEKQFVARSGELIDQIAVLYARMFSVEEMTTLTEFYKTPVGRKFIEATPQLAAEAMQLGNVWGQKIGREAEQKIRAELRERGIEL
jgi:hypothetical protein